MAKLFPAEDATNDPRVFGFVVQFPSGTFKQCAFRQEGPVQDTLETAKECAAMVIQSMLPEHIDDIDRTNVPSLVAAIQKMILDWNEKRRTALHARNPMLQALDATPSQ